MPSLYFDDDAFRLERTPQKMDFRIENLLQDQTLDEESETNERNEARSQFTDEQNSLISTATNVALGIASVAAVSMTGLYMMREYLAFPCVTGVWFMGRQLDKVILRSNLWLVGPYNHREVTESSGFRAPHTHPLDPHLIGVIKNYEDQKNPLFRFQNPTQELLRELGPVFWPREVASDDGSESYKLWPLRVVWSVSAPKGQPGRSCDNFEILYAEPSVVEIVSLLGVDCLSADSARKQLTDYVVVEGARWLSNKLFNISSLIANITAKGVLADDVDDKILVQLEERNSAQFDVKFLTSVWAEISQGKTGIELAWLLGPFGAVTGLLTSCWDRVVQQFGVVIAGSIVACVAGGLFVTGSFAASCLWIGTTVLFYLGKVLLVGTTANSFGQMISPTPLSLGASMGVGMLLQKVFNSQVAESISLAPIISPRPSSSWTALGPQGFASALICVKDILKCYVDILKTWKTGQQCNWGAMCVAIWEVFSTFAFSSATTCMTVMATACVLCITKTYLHCSDIANQTTWMKEKVMGVEFVKMHPALQQSINKIFTQGEADDKMIMILLSVVSIIANPMSLITMMCSFATKTIATFLVDGRFLSMGEAKEVFYTVSGLPVWSAVFVCAGDLVQIWSSVKCMQTRDNLNGVVDEANNTPTTMSTFTGCPTCTTIDDDLSRYYDADKWRDRLAGTIRSAPRTLYDFGVNGEVDLNDVSDGFLYWHTKKQIDKLREKGTHVKIASHDMTNAYFWKQLPPAELQAPKEWANYKSSFTSKSSSFFGSIIGAIICAINVLKETWSKIWTTTQNVDEYNVMGKTWQEKFIVVANCLWLWIVKIWELTGGRLLDWFCGPDVPRSAMLSTLMGDVGEMKYVDNIPANTALLDYIMTLHNWPETSRKIVSSLVLCQSYQRDCTKSLVGLLFLFIFPRINPRIFGICHLRFVLPILLIS